MQQPGSFSSRSSTHRPRRFGRHYRLLLVLAMVSLSPVTSANEGSVATQGDYAAALAKRFGLGELSPEEAVEKLHSLSIKPGFFPDSRWEIDKTATDLFVARIQASIQMLMQEAAEELAIPVPATLSLQVIELPSSPPSIMMQPTEAGPNVPGELPPGIEGPMGLPGDIPLPPEIPNQN